MSGRRKNTFHDVRPLNLWALFGRTVWTLLNLCMSVKCFNIYKLCLTVFFKFKLLTTKLDIIIIIIIIIIAVVVPVVGVTELHYIVPYCVYGWRVTSQFSSVMTVVGLQVFLKILWSYRLFFWPSCNIYLIRYAVSRCVGGSDCAMCVCI